MPNIATIINRNKTGVVIMKSKWIVRKGDSLKRMVLSKETLKVNEETPMEIYVEGNKKIFE